MSYAILPTAKLSALDIIWLLPIYCFADIIYCIAPPIYPSILVMALPRTAAAGPIILPLATNTEDSALSKVPPNVAMLRPYAATVLVTVPNTVYALPMALPSVSPIVESNPPF